MFAILKILGLFMKLRASDEVLNSDIGVHKEPIRTKRSSPAG
jgi:hypothetical protein